MAETSKQATHITDRAGDAIEDALSDMRGESHHVPGPSPNASTNLIINDILLRGVGRMTRMTLEKAIVGRQYSREFAKDVVENRSLVQTLAAYGVTKVATRSVPGALAVGAGLALKVLFDRSRPRRDARRAGRKALRKNAKGETAV